MRAGVGTTADSPSGSYVLEAKARGDSVGP